MTGTTAMTVDLGTCARALSDIVARERDAARPATPTPRDEREGRPGGHAAREGVGDVGVPERWWPRRGRLE